MKPRAQILATGALAAAVLAALAVLAGTDMGGIAFLGDAVAWVDGVQRALYPLLAAAVRNAEDTPAIWPLLTLLAISFGYGALHAVGPGHGKVVIASYVLGGGSGLRKGLVLALAAALLQAVVAVLLVGLLGALLDMTRLEIDREGRLLDAVSYGLIVAVGAWLLVATLRGEGPQCHAGADHGRAHSGSRGFLAVLLASGLRPCSGALLVLLFALAQGMFAVGIAAAAAMAIGTGATVSVLALVAVHSRRWALRIAGEDGRWQARIHAMLALASAAVVIAAGSLLFLAALAQRPPL